MTLDRWEWTFPESSVVLLMVTNVRCKDEDSFLPEKHIWFDDVLAKLVFSTNFIKMVGQHYFFGGGGHSGTLMHNVYIGSLRWAFSCRLHIPRYVEFPPSLMILPLW